MILATLRTTKSLARPRIENDLRRYARVATADHHDLRRLPAFRKLLIAALFFAQTATEKGGVAFEKAIGKLMVILSTLTALL